MICAQSGVVDGFGDVNVYGVQCLSQWRWCGWLVGGQQRTQQPVVQFGVEDRKPQPIGGQAVEVAAGDAGDEPIASEPSQVVTGLVGGVVDAAEQSGHQGTQALVGDAGDGEHAGA